MRRIAREGWRQIVLLVAMLLAFCFLAHNLFVLQVARPANAQMAAFYAQDITAPQIQTPPRGTIVDATGAPLVSTVTVFKLAASPPYLPKQRKARAAQEITGILFPVQLPRGRLAHDRKAIAQARAAQRAHYQAILHQLSRTISYVCLAGDDSSTCPATFDISQAVKDRIDALGLPGITTEARYQPSYPNGGLAAQVLGFVNYQYQHGAWVAAGQYGAQQYYNALLSGIPGRVSTRTDTSGRQIRLGAGADAAPQQGATLRLTIDSFVQLQVERDLARVMRATHALSGTIVVERVRDGAILATASSPSYDPNNWRRIVNARTKNGTSDASSFGLFVNPAIGDEYEPGSTFKPLMVAAGLDSRSLYPWTTVDDTGQVQVGGYTVQNWCGATCNFLTPTEDMRRMLKYSSNVGAVLFSRDIPTTTFYDYMQKFGFGRNTGVDLTGEWHGVLLTPSEQPPAPIWVPAYKDSTAYGQGGISVTPLQLANAFAAVAGGGLLPHPHVLRSYTINGKTYTPSWPPLRRVISRDTAEQVTRIMVDSGIDGEACLALVPGWDVAAKTGTAYGSAGNGSYNTDRTIASTVAFAPADNPQFVVLAVLHMKDAQDGSEVASPLVHQILQMLFNYYTILPPSTPPIQPNTLCPGPLR